jgi:hypothetical protein
MSNIIITPVRLNAFSDAVFAVLTYCIDFRFAYTKITNIY